MVNISSLNAKKIWRAGGHEPWAVIPKPWSMSHEPWAMSHEQLNINNRLINKLSDCLLKVLSIRLFRIGISYYPRIRIPEHAKKWIRGHKIPCSIGSGVPKLIHS